MSRLLIASACLSVVGYAVGAVSAFAAVPPRLPNLTSYFAGQRPAARMVVSHGIRFACFTFAARDGVLSECFAVARVGAGKPKPQGPAA